MALVRDSRRRGRALNIVRGGDPDEEADERPCQKKRRVLRAARHCIGPSRLQRTGFDRLNSGPDARIVPNGWFDLGGAGCFPSTNQHIGSWKKLCSNERTAASSGPSICSQAIK